LNYMHPPRTPHESAMEAVSCVFIREEVYKTINESK